MTTIHNIPVSLRKRIFAALYQDCATIREDDEYEFDKMRDFVPVTAVCRQWRSDALPYLCSILICEYVYSDFKLDDDWSDNSIIVCGHWKTNTGIIVSNRGSFHTNEIRLKLIRYNEYNHAKSLNPELQDRDFRLADVLEMNRFGSASWHNVLTLNAIGILNDTTLAEGTFPDNISDNSMRCFEYLTYYLPSIQTIITKCDNDKNNENINIIDRYINHYNQQLTHIITPHIRTNFNPHELLSNITHLSISDRDDAPFYLTMIHIKKLKYLSIEMSANSIILDIQQREEPTTAVFENLETLVLWMEKTNEISGAEQIISTFSSCQFPKLESLDICNYRFDIAEILLEFPLDQLTSLSLFLCECKGIDMLDPCSFRSLTRLLAVVPSDEYIQKTSLFINELFGTQSPLRHIHIGTLEGKLNIPETSSLYNLRELEIVGSFSWMSLTRLISTLPKLKILILSPSTYDNDQHYRYIEEVKRDFYEFKYEPISTSIEEFNFCGLSSSEFGFACVCLIMIQIPSLLRVRANQEYIERVNQFVNERYIDRDTQPTIKEDFDDIYPLQFRNPEYC